MRFDVFQQTQGATFLMPDRSVMEVEGGLRRVGSVQAANSAEAIDVARNELSNFAGWLPTRIEAYPVVSIYGDMQ